MEEARPGTVTYRIDSGDSLIVKKDLKVENLEEISLFPISISFQLSNLNFDSVQLSNSKQFQIQFANSHNVSLETNCFKIQVVENSGGKFWK
jgi:hypothetical protein